jgi:hypothetical protein
MASLQICAPWDDRLWSLLKSEPKKASKQSIQIINDNLVQRRRHRMHPSERSGTDVSPQSFIPLHGVVSWSGCYVEIPMSIASIQCKVQYDVVFKADGTIEGSGSGAEGNFKVNGAYNLQKGTVAWRQEAASCPVWYNPCSKYGAKIEAEFYGRMVNFSGPGPAQITGTFLTDLGRYCAVNLTCPTGSEAETVTITADAQSTAGQARAEMEQLPTLLSAINKRATGCSLTGKWMPITNEDENIRKRKQIQKQWTSNSDTYHSWEDEDEDEDEDEEKQ